MDCDETQIQLNMEDFLIEKNGCISGIRWNCKSLYHEITCTTNNIKPFIEFNPSGFIIQGTNRKIFMNYPPEIQIVVTQTRDIRMIKFFTQNGTEYNIYCTAEDGSWFWENYMKRNDGSVELILKQHICALEDKLKVLTEMMDKKGM